MNGGVDDPSMRPTVPLVDRWRQRLYALLLCCQLLPARAALACPVCFSQTNEHVLKTYYLTTVLLSLLPLLIMASIGTWLYRRQRAAMSATEPY